MTPWLWVGLLLAASLRQAPDPLGGQAALLRGEEALKQGKAAEAKAAFLWVLQRGTKEQALQALDRLACLEPEQQAWPSEMERLLQGRPPLYFPEGVYRHTQRLWHLQEWHPRAGRVWRTLAHAAFLYAEAPSGGPPLRDPLHRWEFHHLRCGYVEEEGLWRLRFRLYSPSRLASQRLQDYESLAQQTLRTLLGLYVLGREFFALGPRFHREEGVVDVWLCEEGEAGGEQWHGNLYLYGIGEPRDGLEWLRELAHEWGHHTIPPLRGESRRYEPWLSGDVGERLYLWQWFHRLPKAEREQGEWSQEAEGKGLWQGYVQHVLLPGWLLLCEKGPQGLPWTGRGDEAAEALLALAQGCSVLFGEEVLAQTFRNLLRPAPKDFLRALQRSWEERLPQGIPLKPASAATLLAPHLPPTVAPEEPLPFWVWSEGHPMRWEVRVEGEVPGLTLRLAGSSKEWLLRPVGPQRWEALPSLPPGWVRCFLQAPKAVALVEVILRLPSGER